MTKPVLLDLHKLTEDQRIAVLGDMAMTGQATPIILESEKLEPGKIARYIQKVRARYPKVGVIDRKPGPVENTETITFGVLQS